MENGSTNDSPMI